MSKMIKGITIEFNKEDNSYFENCYEDTINPNILIISLLETINDICIDFKLDINEKLSKYIEIGSIDNYMGDFEEQQIKNLQTDFFKQKDQRIAELKGENEQLKKDFAISCAFNEELKQKAVKEFAEALKKRQYFFCNGQTAVDHFNEELEEMLKERGIE